MDISATALSVLIPDGGATPAGAVVQALGRVKGTRVHVVSSRSGALVRFSRYTDTFVALESDDDDVLLRGIARHARHTGARVLLPLRERATSLAIRHRPVLAEHVTMPLLPSWDVFETMMDKARTKDFAEQNRIPMPPTVRCAEREILKARLQGLRFPVLLKPRQGCSGIGIVPFETPEALLSFVGQMTPGGASEYIVQSFIEGTDMGCSALCQEGRILAYTIQRALLPNAQRFRHATCILFLEDDEVLACTERIMASLNYSGIVNVDFRRDARDGRIHLLECNPRYWATLQGSVHVGVNFPYLACLAALGQTFERPSFRSAPHLPLRLFLSRSFRAERRRLGIRLRDTGIASSLSDPAPMLAQMLGFRR